MDIKDLYSLEAEAAVLGSMIIDPNCIPKVLMKLPDSEAFFLPEHKAIFDAVISLFIDKLPIDGVTVRDRLKEQGKLSELNQDEESAVRYLAEVMQSVPSSANAIYYSQIVLRKQQERKTLDAVEQINETLNDNTVNIDEKIQTIQNLALDIETIKDEPDFTTLEDAPDVAEGMFQKRNVLPTGFRDLDKLIFGFEPGEFVILAGRPAMGKSALGMSIALSKIKEGTGVLYFTLEMTERGLTERAICAYSKADLTKVQSGETEEWERAAIVDCADRLKDMPLILSKVGATPEKQLALIRRLKKTHNIGLVIVDYLQLMNSGRKSESRQQEITTISRKLKSMALSENLPILAMSQLNRTPENRTDHRPLLSDLRESGSLEQDADIVLLIYRADYYNPDRLSPTFEPEGTAEITVAKNRRGRTGKIELVFLHDNTLFADKAYQQQEQVVSY